MGSAALAVLTLLAGFADQLYEQGDYDLAALEYARVLYESGDTLSHPADALRLARCWHLLEDHERSLNLYTFLVEGLPEGDHRAMALLGAGAVYSDLGMYTLAREAYAEAGATAVDDDLAFRGELLESMLPLHRMEWTLSSGELSEVALRWEGARRMLAQGLSELAAEGEELPYRSPFWCSASSALLPGSGQLMCGHTSDGLLALGMNAAAGVLFYLALEEENTATAILTGWLAFSFYGANVLGGGRAARYYNAEQRREHFYRIYDRLEEWNWDYRSR
jgi:hypothetical protein